jgi:cellulose synthase/poly-beta-1,6-N-acetylglucosamine synthase-like glycosyltransferase
MTADTLTTATQGQVPGRLTTVPVLSGLRRVEYVAGVALWLAALVYFWAWWFKPSHFISLPGFLIATLTLAWITLLPAYFIGIFFFSRRPCGPLALPARSRVAMVTTKAPSEPFEVVVTTLKAMLAQDVAHDTWLADEDPTPDTLAWCCRHGVLVSTRKDRPDYHRQTWPRRTRCKEGNLAFFYDHYGYERYDFVAQLDADHVPEPDYLRQMLRPFADPAVGYVSAPSICDSNAARSWSARGRLYVEASMHGSLQAGYSGCLAPMCIGSHYAVRTKALKEIGGLGPELAEDHSTTLMMNAHGWRGVHALDAIAHGDGPNTFADLVTQEFQWSRSLVMLLLQYSPTYVPSLPPRLKFQFLFSQLWYPLSSLFMTLMFFMPVIALLTGRNFVNVVYLDFLAHSIPLSIILLLLFYRWRTTGTFRPRHAKVLSWEAMIFQLARWPWVFVGTLAALYDWATGSVVNFRVTPKGALQVDPLPLRVLAPYAILSIAFALPVMLVAAPGESPGFYVISIINAILYALVLLVVIVQHYRENPIKTPWPGYRLGTSAALMALFAILGISAVEHGPSGLHALTFGIGQWGPIKEQVGAAGAGMGERDLRKITFDPQWFAQIISPNKPQKGTDNESQ